MIEYTLEPVLMGGTIKELTENEVKVHLKGRLGVFTLPKSFLKEPERAKIGDKLRFYFSYIQVVNKPGQYDISGINVYPEIAPELCGGKISLVNDTAIEVSLEKGLGTIFVPRRWVFTDIEPKKGQDVEFYISGMKLTE